MRTRRRRPDGGALGRQPLRQATVCCGRLTKSRSATSANASGGRRRVRRERVARRHDEHEPVAPVQHRLQPQARRALGEDADLGAAVDHREHGVAAVRFVHLDPDAGVRGDEARQVGGRNCVTADVLADQADDADDSRGVVGQVGGEWSTSARMRCACGAAPGRRASA
jgi:hypothetical protein